MQFAGLADEVVPDRVTALKRKEKEIDITTATTESHTELCSRECTRGVIILLLWRVYKIVLLD